MPLKFLRVCGHCNTIRHAACSSACKIPPAEDPDSWRINLQDGAGTIDIPVPITPAQPDPARNA